MRNLLARWCYSLSYRLESWVAPPPGVDDALIDMANLMGQIYRSLTANSPFLNVIQGGKFPTVREKNEFEQLEGDDQL